MNYIIHKDWEIFFFARIKKEIYPDYFVNKESPYVSDQSMKFSLGNFSFLSTPHFIAETDVDDR